MGEDPKMNNQNGHFNSDGSCSLIPQRHHELNRSSNGSLWDGTSSEGSLREQLTMIPRMGRIAVEDEVLIDLDELENEEFLWDDEEELQILRVDDISKDVIPRTGRKLSRIAYPQRNPPIVEPFIKVDKFQHMQICLRPRKNVELSDGDFLHITDIIRNSKTDQVKLRGLRYQRCHSMNAMLEKKLNELCLFYEIDLDDPRKPPEQGAVEVSIDKVKALRNIRRTNQSFPLCRNFASDEFQTPSEVASAGGLTARWKYTCKYSSSDDRWNNRWKERTLEIFKEDETTSGYGVSDDLRRFQWRGETIMGGSYQPAVTEQNFSSVTRTESTISTGSGTTEPDLALSHGTPNTLPASARRQKRRRSAEVIVLEDSPDARQVFKKARYEDRDGVETTRRGIDELRIDKVNSRTSSTVIDLTSEPSSIDVVTLSSNITTPPLPKVGTEIVFSRNPSSATSTATIPPAIDIRSSELAAPPPTGAVQPDYRSSHGSATRSVGQMLTFGDAFCGAGGATRGAVMAGFKVKWGFDFWEHACTTWKTNFRNAACYHMASEKFVSMAHGSKDCAPVDVKVDVLHLSPPCQYFSPAHTVNGADDEMNTASLYAVLEVVKVAKPRVVTLEQTFGLLAARFRWYFASLIHMFTALQFSVRWAVVPLAKWVSISYCDAILRLMLTYLL